MCSALVCNMCWISHLHLLSNTWIVCNGMFLVRLAIWHQAHKSRAQPCLKAGLIRQGKPLSNYKWWCAREQNLHSKNPQTSTKHRRFTWQSCIDTTYLKFRSTQLLCQRSSVTSLIDNIKQSPGDLHVYVCVLWYSFLTWTQLSRRYYACTAQQLSHLGRLRRSFKWWARLFPGKSIL